MASIACPQCGERVDLDLGVGPVGAKSFVCSAGHEFGPGSTEVSLADVVDVTADATELTEVRGPEVAH